MYREAHEQQFTIISEFSAVNKTKKNTDETVKMKEESI